MISDFSPDHNCEHAINGLEAFWVLRACQHWHKLMKGHLVFIFCDNYSAVRGFIKGYSGSAPICRIVGCSWRLWIQHRICVWIEWVHTGSNPADALTRPGWREFADDFNLQLEEISWRSAPVDSFQ